MSQAMIPGLIYPQTHTISRTVGTQLSFGRRNGDGTSPPPRASRVLHETARQYYWRGAGSLSIKSFLHGVAFYEVGGAHYAVDDSSYLVLNHDQPYAITIDSESAVESFCIFFERGFAGQVHRALTTCSERLLDEPEAFDTDTVTFFERTYPHDNILSPALFLFRAEFVHRRREEGWIEEQLHRVMRCLLMAHGQVCNEVEALSAVKAATRGELYRRLHRAKDYAYACLERPITLNELAKVACLSPNHLLRMFKQLFHQTPHQFLTKARLERAQKLLVQTDRPIIDICLSVGYESVGSFNTLFRRRVGMPPTTYRCRNR